MTDSTAAAADSGTTTPATAAAPAAAAASPAPNVTTTVTESGASASVPFATNDKPAPAADFRDSLGDYKDDPAFKDFKDIPSLAKAFRDTKEMVGKKFSPPGADAPAEVKAEFYKALGVPEKPEDYGLKAPDDLPEELKGKYDEALLSDFSKLAKEINLTPEQAKALQSWNDGLAIEQIKTASQTAADADTYFDTNMQAYGEKPVIQAAIAIASKAVSEYVPQSVREDMAANKPGSYDVALALALAGQRKELTGEDTAIHGDTVGGETEQSLRAELRAVMQKPEYSSAFVAGPEAHREAGAKAKEISQKISQLRGGGKR